MNGQPHNERGELNGSKKGEESWLRCYWRWDDDEATQWIERVDSIEFLPVDVMRWPTNIRESKKRKTGSKTERIIKMYLKLHPISLRLPLVILLVVKIVLLSCVVFPVPYPMFCRFYSDDDVLLRGFPKVFFFFPKVTCLIYRFYLYLSLFVCFFFISAWFDFSFCFQLSLLFLAIDVEIRYD